MTQPNAPVQQLRGALGLSQAEMANWLNERLNRRYDKSQISRWETAAEATPRLVLELVNKELSGRVEEQSDQPRTGTVLSFSMQKGGVGKTTSAVNVAYALLRKRSRIRVLLIDADSQANATLHVGFARSDVVAFNREERALYYALVKKRPLGELILETQYPGLDLVPSAISLANADVELAASPLSGGLDVFKEALDPIRERYDYIVIDCAPNLGYVTLAALGAADFVVIPVETEPLALDAMGQLFESIRLVRRRQNPDLKVLGVLPTKFKPRLTQDKASLEDLKSLAAGQGYRVFSPIPHSTLYPQSSAAGQITLSAGDMTGFRGFAEVAMAAEQAQADGERR